MIEYRYKILDNKQNIKEGIISGLNEYFVKKKFEEQGSAVLFLSRTKATFIQKHLPFLTTAYMKPIEKILFFRNFSMMLNAGIPISTALTTLKNQIKRKGSQDAIIAIIKDVENGRTLSESMLKFPKLFPQHISKTVQIGEQSGTLSDILDKISEDLESNYQLRRKVIGAIIYPVIILSVMVATAFILIIFVLPQIMSLYADLGAETPAMTVMLDKFGKFCLNNPILILITTIIVFVLFYIALRIEKSRFVLHTIIVRIPVFGTLIREYNLVRFTRALTTLLASGITLVHALDAARSTIKNEAYIKSVDKIYPIILNGGKFSEAIAHAPFLYPEQLRQTILIGEQTGKLRESFQMASTHYERSVNYQTQMLTTLIEPILMLVAGVLVGTLAFAIFMPLYGVTAII